MGSSTNFFGISSILKQQDGVITRLEENYKEIRREISDTKQELKKSEEHSAFLEDKVVPRLIAGKLDGLRLGVIMVGTFDMQEESEEIPLTQLMAAGASIGFRLRTNLDQLDEMSGGDTGSFVPQLGKELLNGSAFGSGYTDVFMKEGLVVSGGFEKPVDGILFILCEDLDLRLFREILIPLENLMRKNGGIVTNTSFGENETMFQVLRFTQSPLIKNIETLDGQVKLITSLTEIFKQKQGLKKSGA